MVTFEGCARRMGQIGPFLEKIGLGDLEEARTLCLSRGIDVEEIVKGVRDDMVTDTLAFAYERKYKKTKQEEYIKKAGLYWQMLIDSKDAKYAERSRRKLKEYFNIEF